MFALLLAMSITEIGMLFPVWQKDFTEKFVLRKRAVIESINYFLKNICQIRHEVVQTNIT